MPRLLPLALVLALLAALTGTASAADLDDTAALGAAFLPPDRAATVLPGPLAAGPVLYATGIVSAYGSAPVLQRTTYSLAKPGRASGTIDPYAGPAGGTITALALAPDAATAQTWVTRMITADDPVPVATPTQIGDVSRRFSSFPAGTNDRACYVRFAVGRVWAQLAYDVGPQQAECSDAQFATAQALAALQAPLLTTAAATPAAVAAILPKGGPTGGTPLGFSVQPSSALAVDTVGSLVWSSHRRSYARLTAPLAGVAAQSGTYMWNMHPWVMSGTFIPFPSTAAADAFVRLQARLAGNGMEASIPGATAYYAFDNGRDRTRNAFATIWVAAGARVGVVSCSDALGLVPGDPSPSIGRCGRQARLFATRWALGR